MQKIAKEFFKNHAFVLDKKEDFFDTDLAKYFQMLYCVELCFAKTGFIKVFVGDNQVEFYENIFYDWADKKTDLYVSFKGIDIEEGEITNSEIGRKLSDEGYVVIQNDRDHNHLMQYLPVLNYDEEGCERDTEPFRTHKFSTHAWGKPSNATSEILDFYFEMEFNMRNVLSFSPVLRSLDAFDMIGLEWKEGRSILPHNDLDFRMIVNQVSYNTYHSDGVRVLGLGEYDWYDYTFLSLYTKDWELTNNITAKKKEKIEFVPDTERSIFVNVFNPRFYHEVKEMKGEGTIYSAPSHLGFRKIVDNFRLKR